MPEAFCVKDRKNVEVKNPKTVTLKNKVLALTGTCPICGKEVFRFIKRHEDPEYALELAIEREKGAILFYSEAATKTEDADAKRMLKWLANEEEWHRAGLERQLKSLVGKKVWQEWKEKSTPIGSGELEQAAETAHTREATSLKHSTKGEVSAVRTAMRAEKKAIDFYRKCAETTTDPAGRDTFLSLVKQEEGHLRLLERVMKRTTEHRGFLQLPRFV